MSDVWDDSIKRLFREHPQDFVSWLLEGAVYRGTVSGELKNRTRRTDILMDVVQQKSQKEGLLHVEIQSEDDKHIVKRLLEYNLMATLTYEKPVLSWLILLRPMPEAAQSPLISALFDEIEAWRFSYVIIKLWETSAEELLRTGLIGPLPLIPLTNGGTEQKWLATTIATLYAADEYELLSLTKLLAGLVMKHKDQQELLERLFAMYKDIVEESWVYQQIAQRGLEQGLEKGLEQGLGLGEQRALVAIIQRRFPAILQTAKDLIDGITDADTLERLVVEVSVAQNAQDVLHILRAR
ncbi:MAG: Rpn family recombination-promoting nuclease/putative transposase [Ktedonobacteraceae bacterium]